MIKPINTNYSVDTSGNVWSNPRPGTKGGKLSPFTGPTGYAVVMLAPSRVPKKVHRLVAEVFLPNPDNKPFVNHKNGNKLDNRVENLEWCTARENALHAHEHGLVAAIHRGSANQQSKLTEVDVLEIRKLYKPYCRENGTRALANRYGVSHKTVAEVISKTTWRHI